MAASIARIGAAEDAVENALPWRIDDALPDEAHDRKRQHHRGVENALVQRRAFEIAIKDVGDQHAERGADHEQRDHDPQVVEQRLVEVLFEDREQLLVVPEADPFERAPAHTVPVRERQDERADRGNPHERDVEK